VKSEKPEQNSAAFKSRHGEQHLLIHFSPFTLHFSPFSAADRRQNRNFAIGWKRCVEQFLTPHIVVIEENVYVLSELTLFIQHAIPQADVTAPQALKGFANGGSR